VPYAYGVVGVIYDANVVDEADTGSWDLLWNEKYSGKILQFNNPRDGLATAMFAMGLDVNSTNTADWDKALAYIPVYYSIFTKSEEPLEIANNAAFAELLRPVFADTVNAAFEATVVPYETANEIVYVFTVVGDIEHVAIDGECEFIIEIRVPKAA